MSGVAHEFGDFHYLRPARFIVVRTPASRDQSPLADSMKSGFLDDPGAQRIVSLHQELKTFGLQKSLELLRLTDFAIGRGSHGSQQPKMRIIDFLLLNTSN